MSIFDSIIVPNFKRSTFDLSHEVKLTTDFGKLTPFMCEEVVPGDTWYNNSDVLVRFSPLIAPVMHNMYVSTHFFYVPFRLVWDDYELFESGGRDGKTEPIFPKLPMLGSKSSAGFVDTKKLWSLGSLADFLNYPTSDSNITGPGMMVSALPFRAYQLIYNDYYRDENLELDLDIDFSSGEISKDSAEYEKLLTLRYRAWAKDYLTSALPWPQKGDQQTVPLSTVGSVANRNISFQPVGNTHIVTTDGSTNGKLQQQGGSISSSVTTPQVPGAGEGQFQNLEALVDNSKQLQLADGNVVINGTSFTINDLRRAYSTQRYLEAKARGGSGRLKEWLLSIFGVDNDDLRLQRPEFLGGSSNSVQVSDILQTSQTTETSPQGQYAGLGYSYGDTKGFKKTFKERGYIIGIMSVMPAPAYTEGLPRTYRKFHPTDFYLPQFANLGEQEIFDYEVSLRQFPANSGHDKLSTFGYAPRYSEYKYIPSRLHGDFKNINSYGFWTLNRYYEQAPLLSNEFIKVNPVANDLNRIFAVEDESSPKLLVQISNHTKARRLMPYNPNPSL